jgi:hypothetical protein
MFITSQTPDTAVTGFQISTRAHLAQLIPHLSPIVSMITNRLGNLKIDGAHFCNLGRGCLLLASNGWGGQWRVLNASPR